VLGMDSPLLLFAIESMEMGLPSICYLRQVISLGAGSVVKQSVGEDRAPLVSITRDLSLGAKRNRGLSQIIIAGITGQFTAD